MKKTLEATNRVKEARTVYEGALQIFEKSSGPDHPKNADGAPESGEPGMSKKRANL